MEQKMNQLMEDAAAQRRDFVKKGLMVTLSGIAGISLFAGCKDNDEKEEEGEGQEVSPPEDLMQEHGLLNRVLLIYDTCRMHLTNKQSFPKEALTNAERELDIEELRLDSMMQKTEGPANIANTPPTNSSDIV